MTGIPLRIGNSLAKAYQLLKKNDPLILSSSTAFFCTFAIGPILILLTDLLGLLWGMATARNVLFSKIEEVVGTETAGDIFRIVDGFKGLEIGLLIKVLGTLFFYFVATTLFGVIKQAIHQLWNIRKKQSRKLMYIVRERLTGIGMVILAALLTAATHPLDLLLDEGTAASSIMDFATPFLVMLIWFILLFKFLPEARIQWKVAGLGGLFTTVLFNAGAFGLSKILVHKKFAMIFGPSGSAALVLLFTFYCSFILYLGASFMFEYAKASRKPILPGKYGVEFKEEVES